MTPQTDLDLDEDMRFQAREWRFQRWAWIALGIFVALGLAGLSGPGPLSKARAEALGLRIEYERFCHMEAETEVKITYRKTASASLVKMGFSGGCMTGAELDHMRPEPESQAAGAKEAETFAFRFLPTADWVTVKYVLTPRHAGIRRCLISVDGDGPAASSLAFRQWILP